MEVKQHAPSLVATECQALSQPTLSLVMKPTHTCPQMLVAWLCQVCMAAWVQVDAGRAQVEV